MASYKFKKVYIKDNSTISSYNEKIYSKFTCDDLFMGEKTSEKAEEKMQKIVYSDLSKNHQLDFVIGSDLSNELGVMHQMISKENVPFLGVYSACASYCEGLIIAASLLHEFNKKNALVLVSSHNLNSERTYKYPIEYGTPRRFPQTFTLTAAAGSVVTREETKIKLEACTIGKVIDSEIKDVSNLGAVMAPAAYKTLLDHLTDLKRDASYYDVIITGDLGRLGAEFFLHLLKESDITLKNYMDAGSEIITDKKLTDQGGSGPVCLPLLLIDKILLTKKYKKILIIGTGSLHNQILVNQKRNIPSVAHAISLEVTKWKYFHHLWL